MGSGFSKMKKQAKMMQEQFRGMQEALKNTIVEGRAGNDLVVVTMNGEKEILKIAIKPECATDIEALQDLIVAACKDAMNKMAQNQNSMPHF